MRWKSVWMYGGSQAGQAFENWVGGGVEKVVGDAVDAGIFDCAQRVPAALLDDARQGYAIAGAAPGEDEKVWIAGRNGFRSSGFAGVADEFAAGGFDQLLHPGLRVNQRLAPFFAVDLGTVGDCRRLKANGVDAGAEFRDQLFRAIGGMDDGTDQANVSENVGEGVRGEGQHRAARAQDGRQRLHAVGNGGEHQIRFDRQQFFHGGGPGIGNDFQVAMGEFRHGVDAVAGAGYQIVEAAEPFQGEGDAGLQRCDTQRG